VILDTNFLIDIEANRPEAVAKAREIEAAKRPRRVPQVVVFELWTAVGKGSQPDANRLRFERVLDGLPRAEPTDAIVKRAGEIEGRVQAADPNDSGVGVADAVIAATALHVDEPVVTDDGDFRRRIKEQAGVEALAVEEYA